MGAAAAWRGRELVQRERPSLQGSSSRIVCLRQSISFSVLAELFRRDSLSKKFLTAVIVQFGGENGTANRAVQGAAAGIQEHQRQPQAAAATAAANQGD